MGKVISMLGKRIVKEREEMELVKITNHSPSDLTDSFAEIERKNKENKQRIKEERSKANKSVLRENRLK